MKSRNLNRTKEDFYEKEREAFCLLSNSICFCILLLRKQARQEAMGGEVKNQRVQISGMHPILYAHLRELHSK